MSIKKHTRYYVYAYVGGLASTNIVELGDYSNSKSAYAKLEEYLNSHPECVKAYIDEK